MKKRLSLIALALIFAILLPSCTGGDIEDTTMPEVTTSVPTEPVTDAETTAQPEAELRMMPKPYIDIEFTADGGFYDLMDHVDCTLEDSSKGNIVNEELSINGEKYLIPHLYVKSQGGVGRLTYNELGVSGALYELLSDGFTLEMLVLNQNSFNASSNEQCLASSTQGGGYNFTVYKGKYTFSVHTGGSYRNPALQTAPDRVNMTHLVGVYDPAAKIASIYVNGVKVDEVAAEGILALASGSGWSNIILGGDTTGDCGLQILSDKTRIADYKLYPSVFGEAQAATAYELMLAKFTGAEVD
ncbi:MAG: hypothetical protein IIX44_01140, partial [Clostridia bacterium]|nr:hypothetical protein [Clostridia bacterium]